MSSYYTLDENNNVIPCRGSEEFENFMTDLKGNKRRWVKQETVNGKFISTVFLGIDHSYRPKDSPQVFETLVFEDENMNRTESYCARYSTYKQAVDGHYEAVKWVLNGCKYEND